jgi:hypothetical protein
MARKIYIKTFGCQMNEYDSDKMADVLNDSDGVESVQHMEDADIVLYMMRQIGYTGGVSVILARLCRSTDTGHALRRHTLKETSDCFRA